MQQKSGRITVASSTSQWHGCTSCIAYGLNWFFLPHKITKIMLTNYARSLPEVPMGKGRVIGMEANKKDRVVRRAHKLHSHRREL